MHPALARYLNLEAALDTLLRDEAGQVLRAEERPFAEMARAHPEHRARVMASPRKHQAPPEVQESLLFLAAHGAAAQLREDQAFGPRLAAAREALSREGASDSEVDHFLATLVLEEAFGYDDDADTFDRPFFEETLDHVPALAALTRARVQALEEGFAREAEPSWRAAHRLTAQTLFESAWAEGPEPINPEHVQLALDALAKRLPRAEQGRGPVAMKKFLGFLHREKLLGPSRHARLEAAVDRVASSAPSGSLN